MCIVLDQLKNLPAVWFPQLEALGYKQNKDHWL